MLILQSLLQMTCREIWKRFEKEICLTFHLLLQGLGANSKLSNYDIQFIGTDTLQWEKAYKELVSLGPISVHIYMNRIMALKPLVEVGLLVKKIVANLIQTMDVAGRDVVVGFASGEMQTSENIFIIDELLADANR